MSSLGKRWLRYRRALIALLFGRDASRSKKPKSRRVPRDRIIPEPTPAPQPRPTWPQSHAPTQAREKAGAEQSKPRPRPARNSSKSFAEILISIWNAINEGFHNELKKLFSPIAEALKKYKIIVIPISIVVTFSVGLTIRSCTFAPQGNLNFNPTFSPTIKPKIDSTINFSFFDEAPEPKMEPSKSPAKGRVLYKDWVPTPFEGTDGKGLKVKGMLGVLWDPVKWRLGQSTTVTIGAASHKLEEVLAPFRDNEERAILVIGLASEEGTLNDPEGQRKLAEDRTDYLLRVCENHFKKSQGFFALSLGYHSITHSRTETESQRRVIVMVINFADKDVNYTEAVYNGLAEMEQNHKLRFHPSEYTNFRNYTKGDFNVYAVSDQVIYR